MGRGCSRYQRRGSEFFSLLIFLTLNYHRPLREVFEFKSLSMEDSSAMSVPFSLKEIAEVVTSSDDNKSPRPNGFNFSFFKIF